MKFMKTRIATILLTVLVCIIAVSAVAYAASFTKPLAATGNVVTANPDLKFYSDTACLTEMTTLAFGDTVQGDTSAIDVYVKNVGNKDLTQIVPVSDLAAEVGVITFSTTVLTLNKGANQKVTISFKPKIGGTFGPVTPTVNFTGTY